MGRPARNEVIGHWVCPLGGKAEVTQRKSAGRGFNTKCDCCGFQQGNGRKRQTAIWNQAEWLPGAKPVRPANASEQAPEPAPELVPEPAPEPVAEPAAKPAADLENYNPDREQVREPASEPESEPESEPASKQRGVGWLQRLGVALISVAVLGGLWTAI